MGQEIESKAFGHEDFVRFEQRLRAETELLGRWFDAERFDASAPVGGFELEAWLVDAQCRPAPLNQPVLAALDPALFTSELALFNLEINQPAARLSGDFLQTMHTALQRSWDRGRQAAAGHNVDMLMIGILPTLRQAELNTSVMTPSNRYAAINEQIARLRDDEPLQIDILGKDHLRTTHDDVMLESATTSLQLHTQVPQSLATRYYNASILVSAPVLAAGANSPYLFGRDLWAETRVPLFEQAVAIGGHADAGRGPLHRVGFGSGYARRSMFECFEENRAHYPVLLPTCTAAPPEQLAHLRLHNGTIWRWNRPLIGCDCDPAHLRIEHRVLPGGPSVGDVVANAALYFGLAAYYSALPQAPEQSLQFAQARDNFYRAARDGLDARISWLDGRQGSVRRLLLDELIPCARQGLLDLGFQRQDIRHYLDLIEARVESRRNGAAWQRAVASRRGSLQHMTQAYLHHQESGKPVHEWPL